MSDKHILIVEDEVVVAKSIQFALEDMGYTVTNIVFSGEKAIEEVERTHPDLILMDIILKGKMDGVETTA